MGCPEFQIAFDSATPGNTLPFKSFTLTKGTGYAYVELHFSKFWVPRETSVVLRAVEGYDVADTKLNISTDYPSGRAYSDVVAPLVLSKEFRIEFYRNEGSRNTTDVDITTDDFNVTDSQSKCFGFVVDSYYYVLVDDNNPLVATVESVCAADNTNEAICYYDDSSTRAAYLAARSVARLFITKGATYGYLRLKTRAGIVGEQLYIPQHPLGNRKRIALVDDYTSNVALLSLSATSCGTTGYSYSGDTHSGSSGSPVLSYSDHGVVALHHCGDMRGNTGIPAKSIVADLKASGIDVAAFDGVDDESSPSTNFERFPAYTPPVPAVVLPLTTRLKQDGAISLAAGFVSIDKVEFTLSKDTDIVFNVFSVEMADNDTFVDLNGDCKATYLDSMIYLFPAGDSIPVFCADDGNVDGTLKDGSVSFRDPYKRTFLKKALHFSKLWLPRRTSVVLRAVEGFDTPDRTLNLSENYPSGKNYGDILASPVLAKELRIEFYRSEGDFDPIDDDLIADTFSVTDSDSKCFGFVVDSYFYVLMDDTNPMVATDESRCADDNTKRAICYYSDNTTQTVYLASRAVARLNTPRGSGESAFCTGWLLGNQGHIMTNYHCVSTDAEAAGTTVEFMVEDSACSEGVSCKLNECEGKMVSFTTEFIRSSEVLDYALLKLPTDGAQTAQTYGYLRLKTRDGVVGEQLYIPQHPVGGNKRISLEDDYASKLGLLRLNASNCGITGYAYNGDTKTGSSGSPVLSFSDHGVVALHHCGEMCANTGIPAKDIVADLKANGIDVAAFDGIDDGSSHTANSERFPAYTPPVQESTLPLVPRLTLDGAIILASGYVSVDKVEFTLSRDTDVSFAVVSAEIADNGTFIDLNGDCRASYLDSIIYLFLNDSSTPVFFADDGDLSGNVEDGSISYRDPYKRTFVKRGSYVLAVASMGSSQDDALAGKTRADYPPELYTCQARGSYGSYRLQISSTFGDNPFTFTRLPTAIGIDLTSCHKVAEDICST
ncbi:WRKY transcription factor 19 [Phytophthora cinnamomi]|uniref:WRKY transcription factor 19 n=1 Tax=Phytophthora cinnamomi TaxID=4785 RepID=UPI00355969D2|nr:WRKY transcription factor 19 [Phytophthora cinnamomi]